MSRLVWLAGWRHLLAQPGLAFLAMIGVALGVATATAVDLANQGALRAMRLSVEAATGKATHRLVGHPLGVPEGYYAAWRLLPNAPPAAPVIEGTIRVGDLPDPHSLTLLGVDPLAEGGMRPALGLKGQQALLAALMTRPDSGLLLEATADTLGLKPGARFQIEANGQKRTITLLGVIATQDPVAKQGLNATLLVDIGTAQEILGLSGHISRMDVILEPGRNPPLPLPAGVLLLPANDRIEVLEGLTRSFRANLTALSLLALLVGMFIIHNAMAFSVVRRRPLIGLLRAQGVTKAEIFRQTLLDGLMLGIPGTLIGVALGLLLGEGLLHLVARTIDDLYFRLQVTDLAPEPFSLIKGGVLGIGATLLASWLPAREAANAAVIAAMSRSHLEERHREAAPRWARIGVGGMLLALVVALVPSNRLEPGLAAMGLLTVSAALIAPWFTSWLMDRVRGPLVRIAGLNGALAAGGVQRSLSRTGTAVAALTVATAMVSGMGLLIHGFRGTVVQWLESTTVSDIYVSAAGTLSNADSIPLDPELIRRLSSLPGIASVGLGRRVNLETPEGVLRLHLLEIDYPRFSSLLLDQGNHAALWPRFQDDEAILITESLAFRRDLRVGDRITLPTPAGPHDFVIGGIHRDFRSDAGMITLSLNTWRRHWHDAQMSVLGIQLQAGVEPDAILNALRVAAGPERSLHLQSNRALRQTSLEIFDRTFAITRALRLLALLTAFFGVLTALAAIGHERVRELAALRAIGLTVGEIRRSVLLQTGLLGLAAGTLAVPLGMVQGWMLIHVINQRAFGWTLESHPDLWLVAQPLLLAIPTALLAGIPAARRMARTPPVEALRES
ncbi:MAG: FtsX-like permease family protein [Magnetococcales bacterium]|nr:FtsX-like permease family protein [Magnetococcales bacterium]